MLQSAMYSNWQSLAWHPVVTPDIGHMNCLCSVRAS